MPLRSSGLCRIVRRRSPSEGIPVVKKKTKTLNALRADPDRDPAGGADPAPEAGHSCPPVDQAGQRDPCPSRGVRPGRAERCSQPWPPCCRSRGSKPADASPEAARSARGPVQRHEGPQRRQHRRSARAMVFRTVYGWLLRGKSVQAASDMITAAYTASDLQHERCAHGRKSAVALVQSMAGAWGHSDPNRVSSAICPILATL